MDHAACVAWLSDNGFERLDEDRWTLEKMHDQTSYHDMFDTTAGWVALAFLVGETGSSWASPPFATAQAAFVYAEIENWGQ